MRDTPTRQVRAVYDDCTLRVYQAYSDSIAEAALARGTFVSPPFAMSRMTWIKPSFLWIMYRAGWGYKDPNQKRILAIDITREGFEWALAHSCSSHPGEMDVDAWQKLKDSSPVRVQWDPERDLLHRPLAHRAIQVGLSQEAVRRYMNEWIKRITDVTALAHRVHELVEREQLDEAGALLPRETPYILDPSLEKTVGI
jgi:hypothetical protein